MTDSTAPALLIQSSITGDELRVVRSIATKFAAGIYKLAEKNPEEILRSGVFEGPSGQKYYILVMPPAHRTYVVTYDKRDTFLRAVNEPIVIDWHFDHVS